MILALLFATTAFAKIYDSCPATAAEANNNNSDWMLAPYISKVDDNTPFQSAVYDEQRMLQPPYNLYCHYGDDITAGLYILKHITDISKYISPALWHQQSGTKYFCNASADACKFDYSS